MKALQDKVNVDAPSVAYPFGKMRDDNGTGNGTPYDTEFMGDYTQFFEKLMNEAGIVPNGLQDNSTDGWQLYEAFRKLTRPYKLYAAALSQSGTSAPTVTEYFNDFGAIVWTRQGDGIYRGTLTGAFAGKRAVIVAPATIATTIINASMTDDYVTIRSADLDLGAGTVTLTDSLIIQGYIEVKVFD